MPKALGELYLLRSYDTASYAAFERGFCHVTGAEATK
jgi:hypothetical protein